MSEPHQIFGFAPAPLTTAEVVRRLLLDPPPTAFSLLVTPNLDHVRLLRDPEFAAAYGAASLICVDGFPILLYAALRGLDLPGRVTGCDLFRGLARHPALRARRLFFVAESLISAAVIQAWAREKGLIATVEIAPPDLRLDQAASRHLLARIGAFRPDLLVMTLGAPVSEIFLHRHRAVLPPCWAICVGQAVRVELGLAERAPARISRLGLEWLWRLRREPRRLGLRYARDLVAVPGAVLRDLVRGSALAP